MSQQYRMAFRQKAILAAYSWVISMLNSLSILHVTSFYTLTDIIDMLPPEVLVTLLCNWLPVHTVQGRRVQTRRGGVQLGDEVAPQLQHSEAVSYESLFRVIHCAPSGVEFVRLRPPEVIQPGAGVEAEDVPEVGDIVSVGHAKLGPQGGRVQGEAEHVLEQSHQLLEFLCIT